VSTVFERPFRRQFPRSQWVDYSSSSTLMSCLKRAECPPRRRIAPGIRRSATLRAANESRRFHQPTTALTQGAIRACGRVSRIGWHALFVNRPPEMRVECANASDIDTSASAELLHPTVRLRSMTLERRRACRGITPGVRFPPGLDLLPHEGNLGALLGIESLR
jgi:hypothetical protein